MTEEVNGQTRIYQPAAPAPAAERRLTIAGALASSTSNRLVPFRGGYRPVPAATIPASALVYRVENGRLIAQLRQHTKAHGSAIDDLQARQDTAEVQALLHDLLLREAKDAAGPIFQELARQAIQTEPLLVTSDGVVVNGNRRLSAMRELCATDAERYASYAHVSVSVLPDDCRSDDIEYIEAALQLAPETKLAYGWINRRLKIRRQFIELGLPASAIVEVYRVDDESALHAELAELELAEDYLTNYRGEAGQYETIVDAEPLFVGLQQQLAGLSPDLRPLWRLAGFSMIAQRAAMKSTLDRLFPFAAAAPPRLPIVTMEYLAEEEGLVEGAPDGKKLGAATRRQLETLLANPSEATRLAQRLAAIMDLVRIEINEQQAPVRMLKQLGQIRETLSTLAPERLNDKQRRQLKADLVAIQAIAADMLGETSGPTSETDRSSGLANLFFRRRS